LEKLGFVRIRQSGSHAIYRHPDGRWTVVPIHHRKDVGKGLFHKILEQMKLTLEEFEEME